MCTYWSNTFTDRFRMLTRVTQVPLNVSVNSLSLSWRKIPEGQKPLINSEFPYQRPLHSTARHAVGTEFKPFKTPFLKFPYLIKWNKSDAQEKKNHILTDLCKSTFFYFNLLSTEARYVGSSCSVVVIF